MPANLPRKKRALQIVGTAGFVGATLYSLLLPSFIPQISWAFVIVFYVLSLGVMGVALYTANRIL